MKVNVTLELDESWDSYKESMFIEDFLKEDLSSVITDVLNGVTLIDLKVTEK